MLLVYAFKSFSYVCALSSLLKWKLLGAETDFELDFLELLKINFILAESGPR
jgi:hypothetical protein